MITAFVACINDESSLPIRGNGKTNAMTGYGYLNYIAGKKIYSNYYTDFSLEVMGFQKMINTFNDGKKHEDVILMVTEMSKLLNSLGSETQKALYVENFVAQLRKLKITLYYDTQRFMSIHKRLRVHTDIIFILQKIHLDGRLCFNDLCQKEHIINVLSEKPYKEKRIHAFYASEVGKHYDTDEFIFDELIVPKKKVIKDGN